MASCLSDIPSRGEGRPPRSRIRSHCCTPLAGAYQYPAELENAIYRLRQFAREGEDYFARKSTLDIGKLATSGLVDIAFSGLADDQFGGSRPLLILQTLKEKMRNQGRWRRKGAQGDGCPRRGVEGRERRQERCCHPW